MLWCAVSWCGVCAYKDTFAEKGLLSAADRSIHLCVNIHTLIVLTSRYLLLKAS